MSQNIKTVCPHCNKTLRVLESYLGKTAKCPRCKSAFRIQQVADAQLAEPLVEKLEAFAPVLAEIVTPNSEQPEPSFQPRPKHKKLTRMEKLQISNERAPNGQLRVDWSRFGLGCMLLILSMLAFNHSLGTPTTNRGGRGLAKALYAVIELLGPYAWIFGLFLFFAGCWAIATSFNYIRIPSKKTLINIGGGFAALLLFITTPVIVRGINHLLGKQPTNRRTVSRPDESNLNQQFQSQHQSNKNSNSKRRDWRNMMESRPKKRTINSTDTASSVENKATDAPFRTEAKPKALAKKPAAVENPFEASTPVEDPFAMDRVLKYPFETNRNVESPIDNENEAENPFAPDPEVENPFETKVENPFASGADNTENPFESNRKRTDGSNDVNQSPPKNQADVTSQKTKDASLERRALSQLETLRAKSKVRIAFAQGWLIKRFQNNPQHGLKTGASAGRTGTSGRVFFDHSPARGLTFLNEGMCTLLPVWDRELLFTEVGENDQVLVGLNINFDEDSIVGIQPIVSTRKSKNRIELNWLGVPNAGNAESLDHSGKPIYGLVVYQDRRDTVGIQLLVK